MLRGNLIASIALVLILGIAIVAVDLHDPAAAARSRPDRRSRQLIGAGTVYFALIGIGFMFAEISLLQFFGVFLGHPIYAMGVCLFSLILSTGLGSLASGASPLATGRRIALWGLMVGAYLIVAQARAAAALRSDDRAGASSAHRNLAWPR